MGGCISNGVPNIIPEENSLDISIRNLRKLPVQSFFTNNNEVKFDHKYLCSPKLLGKGSSGLVYEGSFREDNTHTVAVKLIQKTFIKSM
jgi:hypothetical protein